MTVQPLFGTAERPTTISATMDERPPSRVAEAIPPGYSKGTTLPSTPAAKLSAAANAEVARSLLLRTNFLRRVAHDIASPTGLTMTVLEELAAESTRPELVAMARRGLRRLLRLSEQLALTSDVEAGSFSPDVAVEDVRAIVKSSLEQAVSVDGRRDIVTSCDVSDEKLNVEVDRRLIASALREVIGNAIRIASSRVAIDIGREDGRAVVRVQDDGPGFSNEALTNLGHRFTAGSTTRGLGLSLSLAKDILSAHGGQLTVDVSSLPPGRRGVRGAAVTVTLPLASD